jgi:hypothetical protein
MKAVVFTPAAIRQWLKLSADIRKRIDAKLMIYATNGSGDVKRLRAAGFELAIGALSSSRMPDQSPSLPSATAGRYTTEREAS